MLIVDFISDHIELASVIAKDNYEEERRHVTALPPIKSFSEFNYFTDNKLGVAAFENGQMIGYLCCYSPFGDAFRTTGVRGTYSPVHANGAVYENREMIYKRLYQAAAEKWVEKGIASHAIALYAHDTQAINSFFTNSFGSRILETIRPMEKIQCNNVPGYSFTELEATYKVDTLELKNLLIDHLGSSPIFMLVPQMTETDLEMQYQSRKPRYFVAYHKGKLIAWIEITDSGENFASDDTSVQNICGAYCLPEHRGKDVFQNLLNHVMDKLKSEGYSRLAVEFESFNPTAYGFWLKYFDAYIHSVVRRIDDKALQRVGTP